MLKQWRLSRPVVFLSSLKLAVVTLSLLIGTLVYGTILESKHNALWAKWVIYQHPLFWILLLFLALNILFAALVRLPPQKRLYGFYTVHLGLLFLLSGSFLTGVWGIDGNLRLMPDVPSRSVVIEEPTLYIFGTTHHLQNPEQVLPLPRATKTIKSDKIFTRFLGHDIFLKKFIPFAVGKTRYEPSSQQTLIIKGVLANDNVRQPFALDSTENKNQVFGPLTLHVVPASNAQDFMKTLRQHSFTSPQLFFTNDDAVVFGKDKDWHTKKILPSESIVLPWMGLNLQLDSSLKNHLPVQDWQFLKPRGDSERHFVAQLKISDGSLQGETKEIWVEDTKPTTVKFTNGQSLELMLGNRLHDLPFEIKLNKFVMTKNPGTNDPASFESWVEVHQAPLPVESSKIHMNHPLKSSGYNLYQASYFQIQPEEFGSVLSVNRDPGRFMKYAGSLFIVLGSWWHFHLKRKRNL